MSGLPLAKSLGSSFISKTQRAQLTAPLIGSTIVIYWGGVCQRLGVNFTFHRGSPATTLDFHHSCKLNSLFHGCKENSGVLRVWPFIPSLGSCEQLLSFIIMTLQWNSPTANHSYSSFDLQCEEKTAVTALIALSSVYYCLPFPGGVSCDTDWHVQARAFDVPQAAAGAARAVSSSRQR